jgi:hypothetical protein
MTELFEILDTPYALTASAAMPFFGLLRKRELLICRFSFDKTYTWI